MRQITTTIPTLSFPEFIDFRGPRPKLAEDYRYERLLQEYLVTGGIDWSNFMVRLSDCHRGYLWVKQSGDVFTRESTFTRS